MTKAEMRSIPYSTLVSWNDACFSGMIGFDSDDPLLSRIDFHRKFMAVAVLSDISKCLWHVYVTYAQLLSKIRGYKALVKQNLSHIVACIERISPVVGVRRACKAFRISVQKFYRARRSVPCSLSALNLCKRLSPMQLSLLEKNIIARYLHEERLLHWPLIARYFQMLRDGAAFLGKQTFYNYAKVLGYPSVRVRKPKQKIGIRASRSGELHAFLFLIYLFTCRIFAE